MMKPVNGCVLTKVHLICRVSSGTKQFQNLNLKEFFESAFDAVQPIGLQLNDCTVLHFILGKHPISPNENRHSGAHILKPSPSFLFLT
jgi:hypothetical protein